VFPTVLFAWFTYKFRYSQRLIYINTTCASCNAPLDNSEQLLNIEDANLYCSRNSSANHLSVSCEKCNKKYPSLRELKLHTTESHYLVKGTFRCAVQGCAKFFFYNTVNDHFQRYHPNIKYYCAQCGTGFDTEADLDRHGEGTMHAPYKCRYPGCASEPTRIGDLHRHQLKHKKIVPRHPCPHCRK
jgi:general transcription factor IIIA